MELVWWRKAFEGEREKERGAQRAGGKAASDDLPTKEKETPTYRQLHSGQGMTACSSSLTHRVSRRTVGRNVPMCRLLYMHGIPSTALERPQKEG